MSPQRSNWSGVGPRRKVVTCVEVLPTVGFLAKRIRWRLTLECGHVTFRFKERPKAPTAACCETCAKEQRQP